MVKGYKDYDRSLMLAQLEFNHDFSSLAKGLSLHAMLNTHRTSRFDIKRSYSPFYYDLDFENRRTGDYMISCFNETEGREFLDFYVDDGAREQKSNFHFEARVDYKRIFHKRHNISGMLVSIIESEFNAKAQSLQLSLPRRNAGISGRATYSLDNKYYAEFNFGYNGSERFDKYHRFGFFPSGGIAWTISNENFWEPLEAKVNNLRVRLTYGLVGNDAIGSDDDRFFYLSEVNMNSGSRGATFGEELNHSKNGIDVTRYANPNVTWEKSKKINLAIELGLFNELDIQADFYKENRENILMSRADIPKTMGLTADVKSNVGEATGEGIDISLGWNHTMPSNKMWLQVQGNFTYARSKYKVFEEPIYRNEPWKSRVGYSLSQQWGYIAERLFIDDADVANSPPQDFGTPNIAGDIKYKDVNGDGKITQLDEVPLGYPTTPEIVYGVGSSFGWRDFDFSVFFQGSARSSFWINASAVQPFVGGKQILKAFADDHYSLENKDIYALWPRLSDVHHENNVKRSTWWLRNGAFLRIKQAEIGYTNRTILKDIASLRFYISSSNIYTFSHFKLWDVEMGGNGLGYPLQRTINVGINLNF